MDGTVVAKDFTGYAKNPAVMTMSNALNQLNSMGKELGLSPVSRKKLNEIQPEDDDSKSAAEKMKEFFE